jgi:hypothetical protein
LLLRGAWTSRLQRSIDVEVELVVMIWCAPRRTLDSNEGARLVKAKSPLCMVLVSTAVGVHIGQLNQILEGYQGCIIVKEYRVRSVR